MERRSKKDPKLNFIKIFPLKPPSIREVFQKRFLEPNIRKTIKRISQEQIFNLPSLSKANLTLDHSISTKKLFKFHSFLNITQTLLQPKLINTSYMLTEIDKIFAKCNEYSLDLSDLCQDIDKKKNEVKILANAISKVNELKLKPIKKGHLRRKHWYLFGELGK